MLAITGPCRCKRLACSSNLCSDLKHNFHPCNGVLSDAQFPLQRPYCMLVIEFCSHPGISVCIVWDDLYHVSRTDLTGCDSLSPLQSMPLWSWSGSRFFCCS